MACSLLRSGKQEHGHHSMQYVGWMRVSGTILLSGLGGGCGSPTAPVGYLKACSGGLTSLLLVMFTPNMSRTVSFLHFTCRYY